MTDRQRFSTGNPWERSIGFSRAIRVGELVHTAGTVAVDAEGRVQGATAYEQCLFIFHRLATVLEEAGSGLDQVFQVTCYLVDLQDAEQFGRAFRETLGAVGPVATCVAVSGLFGEGTRVEIELRATVRR